MMWLTGTATTIAVIAGGWFALVSFVRPMWKRLNFWVTTWENFMSDWAGEPAREGRDAIPGVMERLNNIDGELKRNGGSSIKDAVDRIEQRLVDGDQKFDELYKKVEKLEKKGERIKRSAA